MMQQFWQISLVEGWQAGETHFSEKLQRCGLTRPVLSDNTAAEAA